MHNTKRFPSTAAKQTNKITQDTRQFNKGSVSKCLRTLISRVRVRVILMITVLISQSAHLNLNAMEFLHQRSAEQGGMASPSSLEIRRRSSFLLAGWLRGGGDGHVCF